MPSACSSTSEAAPDLRRVSRPAAGATPTGTTANRHTPSMPPHVATCVEVTADFLAAQPGAVQRALASHCRGEDGQCTGCGQARIPWPCIVATSARTADQQRRIAR